MKDELQKIGNRVKQARLSRHMTQVQLAEATGVSVSFLSHVENGRQVMNALVLKAIADALDVSADSLIRDIPDPDARTAREIERELASCTPKERETILKLVRTMKSSLASLKDARSE